MMNITPGFQKKSPKIMAVDLFCGVGGLTHGLVRGGIRVAAGIDIDKNCRFPFVANNSATFIEKDVSKITASDISPFYEKADFSLLAGCAPCQPFSTYSRRKKTNEHDSQWPLVSTFGRLVKEIRPDFVTMENVPQLTCHSVFQKFLNSLSGYKVWWEIIDCSLIGIPQTRKRLVLLASRFGNVNLRLSTEQTRRVTVREAIGSLPAIRAGECYQKDTLHASSRLSPLNLSRIRMSRPGGTWKDWPENLQASCHRKKTGETYSSVYGRMEWDAPAPTITTQCFGYGNGRFGHPEQDRAISLREAAILQTFPKSYAFVPPGESIKFSKMGRLIGNAVPVRLGEIIARSLVAHAQKI